MKPLNLKRYLKLKVWGLKTVFGPLGPKTFNEPNVQDQDSDFHEKDIILSTIMSCIQ